MMKFYLFFSILFFTALFANAQLNGVYTIGAGASSDFKTPIGAVRALYSMGISAPVIFQIEDGNYKGQLLFDGRIKGSSPTNTISFQGKSLDSTKVVIARDTSITVSIQNCPNLIFKNIRFTNYAVNGNNVSLLNSDSCSFIKCNFNAGEIDINRCLNIGLSNFVAVNNCRFQSSFTGLYSYTSIGLSIDKCHFINLNRNGIELVGCTNPIISKNLLDSFLANGDADPIELNKCNGGVIDGNRMCSGEYGVLVTNSNKSWKVKNEIVIQNNEFTNLIGAFRASNVSRVSFFHNSIYHFEMSGYAINISETDSLKFANNNVVMRNVFDGFTIDLVNDSASLLLFDWNNIYFKNVQNPSNFLGKEIYSFNDLKKAYSVFNKKSISVNPYYNGLLDLRSNSPALNNSGVDLKIPNDILGGARPHPQDKDSVDIGCFEYALPNKDLDFVEIIEPKVLAIGNNKLSIDLINAGSQIIGKKSIEIEYSYNNGSTWILDTLFIDTLLKGDKVRFTFSKPWRVNSAGSYTLKVRLAKGLQNEIDPIDEIEKVFCTGVSGTYVIGQSANAHFSNFKEAINFLSCGVTGPVVFNVEAGIYAEVLSLDKIAGTSNVNTVSFIGNATQTALITSDWYYTVNLFGSEYVVFEGIGIENTAPLSPTISNAISLQNNASYNVIKNCIITMTNPHAAIREAGLSLFRGFANSNGHNTFIKNVISSTQSFDITTSSGLKIIGNTCNSGIYLKNTDSVTILKNVISLDNDGYALTGYDLSNIDISGNYFKSTRGLILSNQTKLYSGNMVNNVFISTKYGPGINIRNAMELNFLHNSVSSHANSCLLLNQVENSVFKNNIFYNFSKTGHVVSWSDGNNIFDYNNINTNGTVLFYYNGKNYASLSAIDIIQGFSNHKNIQVNPMWVDSFTSLNISPKSPKMKGAKVGVTIDFDGKSRCLSSPTMGAYEYTILGSPKAYFSVADTFYLSSTQENVLNLKSEYGDGSIFEDSWYNDDWILLGTGANYKFAFNKVGLQNISLVQGNCQKADTFTKAIVVIDTIKPTFKGRNQLYAKQCSRFNPFSKIGIFDHDAYKIDTLGTWPGNTKKVGNFTYEIMVTDSSGNNANFSTNILVSDSISPFIKLVGSSLDTIYYWSDFNDRVEVWDQCNDVSTIELKTESDIDTNKSFGIFYKNYWAVDHVGNESKTVTRIIFKKFISVNSLHVPELTIYPNPSNGLVTLNFNNSAQKPVTLRILTASGQKVEAFMSSKSQITEQMNLPSGFYLVSLEIDKRLVYSKLIVE